MAGQPAEGWMLDTRYAKWRNSGKRNRKPYERACSRELLKLMNKLPCAMCEPRSVISDESCMVMTTDASDTAAAVSLFRVKKPDADTVITEGLLGRDIRQLIRVAYRKIEKGQRQRLMFESELHATILGCTQFKNFITTATVYYPPSGIYKVVI